MIAVGLSMLIAALSPGVSAPGAVGVSLRPPRASARLGEDFSVRATVTNRGGAVRSGLVANLNVVSWHPDVYVDPEDWSSERTRYLPPLPPGRSANISWTVTPVNGGHFALYVAVLARARRVAVGPGLDLRVAERGGLDSGGLLVLVLGVPAVVALTALGSRARRALSARASPG